MFFPFLIIIVITRGHRLKLDRLNRLGGSRLRGSLKSYLFEVPQMRIIKKIQDLETNQFTQILGELLVTCFEVGVGVQKCTPYHNF